MSNKHIGKCLKYHVQLILEISKEKVFLSTTAHYEGW